MLITREDGQAHAPEISSRRAKGLTVSRDEHSPPREPRAYSRANNGLSCPNFRANPFSEGTDPIFRLPLPTFFYRREPVQLRDLMRIEYDLACGYRGSAPRMFHGWEGGLRRGRNAPPFPRVPTPSPGERIPGWVHCYKEKTTLLGPPPHVRGLRCVAASFPFRD